MESGTPIVNDDGSLAADEAAAETAIDVCTIEKWVYGGEGLARLDSVAEAGGKRVVLVPFVLPGEKVSLRAGPRLHATLIDVLEKSPFRIEPPCPVFADCGGCHYQHAAYERQLLRKVEILREQLQRVGKIRYEDEVPVISGPEYAYRNRAQFRIDFSTGKGKIGYRAAKTHRLVPVETECPVSSPGVNAALAEMRGRLDEPDFPRFVEALEIFSNEQDVQINVLEADRKVARRFYDWCGSAVALDYETAHGTFRVSPKAFFQINRFLIDPLIDAVLAEHSGGSALDLYAGVGLFAVPLGRRFRQVTGVEASRSAALDMEGNAIRAGATTVKMVTARAERYLAQLDRAPDLIVCDPPRAGMGRSVVADIKRLGPPRLTIVSCDPATLARDLATLAAPGDARYAIDSLTLIDLFPQTYHLETVAQLKRI